MAIVVTGATMALTLGIGFLHLNQVEGLGPDVYLLHTEAANAIANGENPYTNAVVVPNGAPTAKPGDMIEGYPYPPITAIAYGIGEWSLDDPRYASLLAWVVVLGSIGLSAIRRHNRTALYVMLLLAAIPGWPLVLRAGWTEPLSLALLTMALVTWRHRTVSGLALGLGLASKQYFVVVAPAALLHRDEGWLRRLVLALAAIAFTVGIALVWDFSAFWSAAVEFHASTPPRPDSSNFTGILAGFGVNWTPPTALGLLVGLLLAIAIGRLSQHEGSFVMTIAIALAASFLLSTQAFANYWFLITGLCALVLVPGLARSR